MLCLFPTSLRSVISLIFSGQDSWVETEYTMSGLERLTLKVFRSGYTLALQAEYVGHAHGGYSYYGSGSPYQELGISRDTIDSISVIQK